MQQWIYMKRVIWREHRPTKLPADISAVDISTLVSCLIFIYLFDIILEIVILIVYFFFDSLDFKDVQAIENTPHWYYQRCLQHFYFQNITTSQFDSLETFSYGKRLFHKRRFHFYKPECWNLCWEILLILRIMPPVLEDNCVIVGRALHPLFYHSTKLTITKFWSLLVQKLEIKFAFVPG